GPLAVVGPAEGAVEAAADGEPGQADVAAGVAGDHDLVALQGNRGRLVDAAEIDDRLAVAAVHPGAALAEVDVGGTVVLEYGHRHVEVEDARLGGAGQDDLARLDGHGVGRVEAGVGKVEGDVRLAGVAQAERLRVEGAVGVEPQHGHVHVAGGAPVG